MEKLFKYHNGAAELYADPYVLNRRLHRHIRGSNLGQLLEDHAIMIQESDPIDQQDVLLARRDLAEEKLAEIAYKVLDLQPLQPDGSGVTNDVALTALYGLLTWFAELKKSISTLQTSSAVTETFSADSSAEKKSSPFTSCADESTSSAASPCLSAQP